MLHSSLLLYLPVFKINLFFYHPLRWPISFFTFKYYYELLDMKVLKWFRIIIVILIKAQILYWTFSQWKSLQVSSRVSELRVTWNDKMCQVHLVHFLPDTWGQPFPCTALVSDGWKWCFKATGCVLGMRIATALAAVPRSFPWAQLGNTVIFLKVKYLRSLYWHC